MQRAGLGPGRSSVIPRQRALKPVLPLAEIAAHPPKVPQGGDELELGLSIAALNGPAQRCSQVIALLLQALEPLELLGPEQLPFRLLR